MAFTDKEIAEHTALIEKLFWSRHRPPVHMRDQIREGQRFAGHRIDLFFVRPVYNRPGEQVEESIARLQYVRTSEVWRLFWKRGGLKWCAYPPHPEVESLAAALRIIDQDELQCFFG
ncbi:MAG TPA: DUF3024 domain-containing protein [Candidatus Saccharimonadales bacterium]|nr:DUF3024 domain-containing protein [Candidatus Saccharimonadales bacterium]